MAKVKITLTDGTQIEHETPCLGVEIYSGGRWETLAVFPNTDVGEAQAYNVSLWLVVADLHKRVTLFT